MMEKESLQRANRAAFLVLIIIAGLAAVAAMLFGMLNMNMPCYTAAGCSSLVTVSLLFHTVCKSHTRNRRK